MITGASFCGITANGRNHPCGNTTYVIPIPAVILQTSSPLRRCSCHPRYGTNLSLHKLLLTFNQKASPSIGQS